MFFFVLELVEDVTAVYVDKSLPYVDDRNAMAYVAA